MEKNVKNPGIIRKNILQILSLIVILVFLMPVMTNAQGGKANFAGNWTFNTSKSKMGTPPTSSAGGGARANIGGAGGRGGMGGGTNFVATQDATTLTVTTTRVGQDGTSTSRASKYVPDGKENTLATPAGGGGGGGGTAALQKYTATWSADGKTLSIVTTRTSQNGVSKTTEVWALTDSKTLSRTSTGSFGGTERKTVLVYNKK